MLHAPISRAQRLALLAAPLLGLSGAALAQPANNTCANAIPIGNTTVSGTTVGASNDGSAACGASSSNADVWYLYTAPTSTTVTVQTCGSGTNYDSVVSVHPVSCPGTSANQIACNDDSCGLQTLLTFQAIANSLYLIRVSGFGSATGSFVLSVGPGGGGQPPINDECSSATQIGNGTFTGTTVNATPSGASQCAGDAVPDVYYLYTAPTTRTVTASTCNGTNYDSVLSVHSGCPATTKNQIACNNDSCGLRAQVDFPVVAGNTYVIRVGGASGTGAFTLSMGDPPPPGPNGPDVTYQDSLDVTNFGAVGGVRGYALGSSTCNIGDANLLWTNFGTPALAMNAYRLQGGRLVQLGLGFCKTACCAAAGSGCGSCNGSGGSVLGAGCRDVYGSGYNGIQQHLAPRSFINPYTGALTSFPQTSGNEIYRRLQVRESDMNSANFPNALFFVEGHYISSDDAPAGNDMNNASYRRVTVTQGTFNMTVADSQQQAPAISAWRAHGNGANQPDNSVNVFSVDVPGEGRFWVATKVTQTGKSTYLYDYAVYNYNSDISGGSFSIPAGDGLQVSGIGFHDVDYHSGEPYDNTDWTNAHSGGVVRWASPQTYQQNQNSNALRWGTMYNFWFTANTPPTTGQATLGFFKPFTSPSISFEVPVPSGSCQADWNGDATVNSQDFFDFLADFFNNNADFNSDGVTNSQDFFDFIGVFFTPC